MTSDRAALAMALTAEVSEISEAIEKAIQAKVSEDTSPVAIVLALSELATRLSASFGITGEIIQNIATNMVEVHKRLVADPESMAREGLAITEHSTSGLERLTNGLLRLALAHGANREEVCNAMAGACVSAIKMMAMGHQEAMSWSLAIRAKIAEAVSAVHQNESRTIQ